MDLTSSSTGERVVVSERSVADTSTVLCMCVKRTSVRFQEETLTPISGRRQGRNLSTAKLWSPLVAN